MIFSSLIFISAHSYIMLVVNYVALKYDDKTSSKCIKTPCILRRKKIQAARTYKEQTQIVDQLLTNTIHLKKRTLITAEIFKCCYRESKVHHLYLHEKPSMLLFCAYCPKLDNKICKNTYCLTTFRTSSNGLKV